MATAAPLHAVPDLEPDLRAAPRSLRPGSVRRPRLVRELSRAPGPLAVLVAPAGYGKTTLLQQWAETDPRPFVWLAADHQPEHVLGALADRADDPMVLVVDDAQRLPAPDALLVLAEHAAPGTVLVLASRCELSLPLGRMRADGAVTELGASDLAMTGVEAATFLRRTGLRLAEAETELIVRRTEGWPAGLRLAELSLREQENLGAAVGGFAGDDRFVAEFIRDEMLADLADEDIAFLTDVAPLEPLTGPLCDAVLGRRGSAAVLRDLAHGNLPLTALDRSDERFRAHPLLAEMLRGELRRDEPERAAEIHRRASAWHEGQGDLARATDHAMAAGDVDRVGRLVWRAVPGYAADGRASELGRWLDDLHDIDIAARPSLALAAAFRRLADGDRDGAERWADAAERGMTAPDASVAPGLALVRAYVARDGAERMREDATRAYARAEPDSPLRASACLLVGAADRITGDRERARAALEEGARRSGPAASVVRSLCLAQLALLALDEGERDDATRLADRACACLVHADDRSAAPVFATSALVCAVGGRIADARRDAATARRLLGESAADAPWAAAQVRLVLASAELRLSDAAAARELLTEASRLARAVPDAHALQGDVADAWERADTFAAGAVAGPTSLTTAELRVLRFLPSHLSFREIAARLHVSANTVKSQAHAVYRKLDASSRSEAVARARAVGLVDG